MAVVPSALGKKTSSGMGENCTALLFVDVAAFRIELHDGNQSTLAKQFNAQIRVEKTPCGSRVVCVGKK